MNNAEYRPDEAARVVVKVTNVGDTPLQIRQLDSQSVELAYTRFGETETPVFRHPVHARRDPVGRMVTVEPGNAIEQMFVFTTLTQFTGPMSAQVHYDPNPPGSRAMGTKRYSEIGRFEVKGPRMYRRDAAGLIGDGDAIAIARRLTRSPVSGGKAIFYEDKTTGLYVIWVNLNVTRTGADGRTVTSYESYLIDPYLGEPYYEGRRVRPFNPAQAEDSRYKRPAGLPPRGAIAEVNEPAPPALNELPVLLHEAPPSGQPQAPAQSGQIQAPVQAAPPVQPQAAPPAVPQAPPPPVPTPYVSPQTQAPASAPPAGQ